MKEVIEGSDRRCFGTVATTMFLFYAGLAFLDALWYFIYYDHWWVTSLALGLIGWFIITISWQDLWTGTYHTRDFLYSVDEKVVYSNGVFMRVGNQGYILSKKYHSWDIDTEKLEKLPVRVYYNVFGKAINRKVNLHTSQLQQISR
jgi:hypothetical protein